MKKLLYIFLFTIIASTVHAYNVSITATAGGDGNDLLDSASGGNPIATGSLGVLLIDTFGDGISLDPINNLADDSFWGNTDNLVAGITGSSEVFGNSVIEFSIESLDYSSDLTGDPFYIAWFPNLSSTSTNITQGEIFGTSRDLSWILPADNALFSGAPNGNGGDALYIVPEPSTYVIGLSTLVLGFSAYRRLRKTTA